MLTLCSVLVILVQLLKYVFIWLYAAWSQGRGCKEACKSTSVSLPVHPWCHCIHLLRTSAHLHVDQRQNCSKGHPHLRLEKVGWSSFPSIDQNRCLCSVKCEG